MKNIFPPEGKNYTYLQTNRSDNLGSLWSTFNMDFQSDLGSLRVAPRLLATTTTADEANLGAPAAFAFFDNRYFAILGSRIFKNATGAGAINNSPYRPFFEDASTGVQTDYSPENADLMVFNDELWATGNGDLDHKPSNGSGTGAWSTLSTSPSGFNMMTVSRKWNRLYLISNTTKVISTDGTTLATSGDYTLSIGASSGSTTLTCIAETSDSIWLGTTVSNTNGLNERASIFKWDGISAGVTTRYYIDSPAIYSLVVKDDIPYAMDMFGRLLKFTGSSFEEIGRLPWDMFLSSNVSGGFPTDNQRFIHAKGMTITKNGTILALVYNNYYITTNLISENFPSGIWEFSEDYGWTHKHAITLMKASSGSITDFGQNQMGTQADDAWVGPLCQAWNPNSNVLRNGMIMGGVTCFTSQTVQTSLVFIDDSQNTIQKKGYFVTTWYSSQQIEDRWERLWAVYKRFVSSTDSIIFKYRLFEEAPTYANITWVNTTSFTTTTDITGYGPTASGFDGAVGGEVEGIHGTGSGQCGHITSIVNNAGTYTVTVDATFTGVTTGTAKMRFQKWIKLTPELTGQIKSFEQMAINKNNQRIQIKCCITSTDIGTLANDFNKMALVSDEYVKITA